MLLDAVSLDLVNRDNLQNRPRPGCVNVDPLTGIDTQLPFTDHRAEGLSTVNTQPSKLWATFAECHHVHRVRHDRR